MPAIALAETHTGVNTGFGGSADTRTAEYAALQQALVHELKSAPLLRSDRGLSSDSALHRLKSHALPHDVVTGAMLTRCNSVLRGHSAVRMEVIDKLFAFIQRGMCPVIPLRGSISASGDLMPLAYVVGALQGSPDVQVRCSQELGGRIVSAAEAMKILELQPVKLGPKEGLGLVNGTAVSCATGALALHDAERLALLAELLTAMATEALRGTAENHHPFIARVRPHAGQTESASAILKVLEGSRMATHKDRKGEKGLYQDRYALRTASQWIGPQLEDLDLAHTQLAVELNSTTDNPLIDVEGNQIHHGGNFQAVTVTSATEKTRLALQMLGKLMFAQSSELINTTLNGTLPPNLCFEDPSLSFAFKGCDINMAAYMSELAFLANPVSSHVQSAEMHNQAVNSLALISARYTADAVELTSLMAATHLYVLCQALDLQALQIEFAASVQDSMTALCDNALGNVICDPMERYMAIDKLITRILSDFTKFKSSDLCERCARCIDDAQAHLLQDGLTKSFAITSEAEFIVAVRGLQTEAVELLKNTYNNKRNQVAAYDSSVTRRLLGRGTAKMYQHVRQDLSVPVYRGLYEDPTHSGEACGETVVLKRDQALIGSRIAVIYEAIRSGRLFDVLIGCFEGAGRDAYVDLEGTTVPSKL